MCNIYNKNINMKKIVRLTESDLVKIVKRVLQEQILPKPGENPKFDKVFNEVKTCCMKAGMRNFPVTECGPAMLKVVMGIPVGDEEVKACQSAVMKEAPNVAIACGQCFLKGGVEITKGGGNLPDISKLPLPKFPYGA
jgi:hypothetical protein